MVSDYAWGPADALPTGDVGAWLRAIVARKALDELRRKGRRVEQPLPDADGDGPQPVAPDELGAHADVLTVRCSLAALSAMDRAVLTLVDLEGWPMAEAQGRDRPARCSWRCASCGWPYDAVG